MNMKNFSFLPTLLLLLPAPSSGAVCTGPDQSPNWYGSVGYPPYFSRHAEKCPQTYGLSRCEQSAVMKDGATTFATDDSGAEVCTLNVDCYTTKQNCNDTLACGDLLAVRDELLEGGHNAVCRHEKTFWQQYTGEVENCHAGANCLDPDVAPTQRQLQPYGWESAKEFAGAFREMGIPVGGAFTSPFARCSMHANLFAEEGSDSEARTELMYMGAGVEILSLNNIEGTRADGIRWAAYSLRNFAGKVPPAGTNNVMITHGFNIKLAFGTAVDEGYCLVLKPDTSKPSLAESYGAFPVANATFEFDDDAFPVDAIARMTPESASLMRTCSDVRSASSDGSLDDFPPVAMDADRDMKVSREEFASHLGNADNADDAFDFVRSVVIQPEVLGKPTGDDEDPVIELGQFYHVNWGWRERLLTGGDISYPWRHILENTIGPVGLGSPAERVEGFKRANAVLSALVEELKDEPKYPDKAAMEEKLLGCDQGEAAAGTEDMAAEMFLEKSGGPMYFPVGPGDSGAAAFAGDSVFGVDLTYPSEWTPDFHNSKLLVVAKCLGLFATEEETQSPSSPEEETESPSSPDEGVAPSIPSDAEEETDIPSDAEGENQSSDPQEPMQPSSSHTIAVAFWSWSLILLTSFLLFGDGTQMLH